MQNGKCGTWRKSVGDSAYDVPSMKMPSPEGEGGPFTVDEVLVILMKTLSRMQNEELGMRN